MEGLLKFISAGGDVGIYVLIFVIWKFNERLIKLEVTISLLLKGYISAMEQKDLGR